MAQSPFLIMPSARMGASWHTVLAGGVDICIPYPGIAPWKGFYPGDLSEVQPIATLRCTLRASTFLLVKKWNDVTCSGGSDWRKIEIMAIDPKTGSGTKTDDLLEYVKFSSIAWTHDHKVRICPATFLLLS